jgi:protein-S-isoprenylcysteine O-methyltransferase Ste14
METRHSPWWYRGRAYLIALIYFCVFCPVYFEPRLYGSSTPAFVSLGRPFGEAGVEIVLWLGVAAIVLCWLVRTWGSAYLRPATVWNADALTDRLIVDGPFRYVRNPLYFGNVLLAVGLGLFAPLPGFVLAVVANTAFVYALIGEESSLMRARYGTTFDRFVAAVPALFPRFSPAAVPGTLRGEPSFMAGMRSEFFTAGFAAGAVALAIGGTRALPLFYAFAIAGYVARVLTSRIEARIRVV